MVTSREGRIDFKVYLITDRKLFSGEDMMLRGIGQALKGATFHKRPGRYCDGG